MMTDPVADMLTRIRNANRIERSSVDMPATRLKKAIAQVLKDEGYILDYHAGQTVDGHFVEDDDFSKPKLVLRISLKYGPEGEKVLQHIERYSRPGLRIYRSYQDLKPVLDGLGITILSTSKGVMSDRQAKAQRLGGELLCTVW